MGKTYKANSDRYDQESKQAKQQKKALGREEKQFLKNLGM